MRRWSWFWMGALVALLVAETWAVASRASGDTLSEQVIPMLLSDPRVWLVTLVLWLLFAIWLTWHWWFQYRSRRGQDE